MNKGLLFFFLMFWGTLLHAQNQNVVIDGVTFSADGKTLISYPRDKVDKEYVVPDGTEVIGKKAFAMNNRLQRVILPISLKEIGDEAFESCWLCSVTWGRFPEIIGKSIFSDTYIEEFYVSNENSNCTVIDNVLFSADRKILLRYPSNRKGYPAYDFSKVEYATDYVVPEGTELIYKDAFESANIHCVTLPSTLKEIGDFAFNNCFKLETVTWRNFPKIGNSIFWNTYTTFKVSDDNEECTLVAGVLFSKDKKRLLLYPMQIDLSIPMSDDYIVPEGTEIIGERAFDGVGISKIVLPSSLQRIENLAFRVRRGVPVRTPNYDNYYMFLESLVCESLTPPTLVGDPFIHPEGIELWVSTNCLETYRNTPIWKEFKWIYVLSVENQSMKDTNAWLDGQKLNVVSERYIVKVQLYDYTGILLLDQPVGGQSYLLDMESLHHQGGILVKVVYNDVSEDIFKLVK